MDDNYIYFELDSRKLKINKENPDDILMLKTHCSRGKMKKPRWNQIKIQNDKQGYKHINIKPTTYKLHRVNYYAHNQDWDIHNSCIKTNSIDHKKDKGNLPKHQYNNIENLRVVTSQENNFNRNCKGYCWDKSRQKWMAYIAVNYKQKTLGYFDLEEEAKNARLEAKKIYHDIK
jgi:hypothetical protein